MEKSRWAFIRIECMGVSVLGGVKDTVSFLPGEVIPVIEDFEKDIVTETADGVRRYVAKQWVTMLPGYEQGNNFIRLEDAADVLISGIKLFNQGKSAFNLPINSLDVFKTAQFVVEDYFARKFDDDDEDEPEYDPDPEPVGCPKCAHYDCICKE